jgi:hypothetical protein
MSAQELVAEPRSGRKQAKNSYSAMAGLEPLSLA